MLYKLRTVLFAACALVCGGMLLCGCAGESHEQQQTLLKQMLSAPFKADCTFTADETEFTAVFSRVSGGEYRLEYISPASVNGWAITLRDGTVTSAYGEQEFSLPWETYSADGAFAVLCRMCEQLPAAQLVQSAENQSGTVTFDYGGFTVTANSGVPCAVSAGELSIKLLSFEAFGPQAGA